MRDVLEMRAVIRGNVQGVGFRAKAKQHADKLQIKGFVRNLPNGDVEICAQGEKSQLKLFLSELKQKFSIEESVCEYHPADRVFSEFKIMI